MQNLLRYHHTIDPMYAQVEDDRKDIVWHSGNPPVAFRGIVNAILFSLPFWIVAAIIVTLCVL
jgi:hypothetical protein